MKPYEFTSAGGASTSRANARPYEILPPVERPEALTSLTSQKGYEFSVGGGCGCSRGSACKDSGGSCGSGSSSWEMVASQVLQGGLNGLGVSLLPGWALRDGGVGSGAGPASNICLAIGNEIQDLRGEIPRRWRRISDSPEDQRRIREAWDAVDRACRFDEERSPCDVYTVLLGHFGDPNRNVELYNALNAIALRCGREDDAFRRAERTGLGRILRCILATAIARDIERDVARRRGATPPYRYEYDIAPLERRLAGLESLARLHCGPPRADAGSRLPGAVDGGPSSGEGMGSGYASGPPCTLIGRSGCNRRTMTGTCTYGGECGRQCSRTVSCGSDTGWEVPCNDTDPC